jgi:uncharacterized protein YdeI (YjbR/CyaY-like superfamily)
MQAAGRAAFERRRESAYSYEVRTAALAPAELRGFRANARAWRFYEAAPPWYRRVTTHWITSAKRPETRARRLDLLIGCCAREAAIPGLEGKLPARRRSTSDSGGRR